MNLNFKNKIILFYGICALSGLSTQAAPSAWSKPSEWSNDESPLKSGPSLKPSTNLSSSFTQGSHNLALDLGQIFLMGDLTQFSDSIGVQVHYDYGVSEVFSFDSSLGYSEHSSGKYSMASLLTGMRLNLGWYDRFTPYMIFGLGFYRPQYRNSSQSSARAELEQGINPSSTLTAILFGLHLGPGVNLQLTQNLFFGASLALHYMFGVDRVSTSTGKLISLGGTYTSFLLHIGTTL